MSKKRMLNQDYYKLDADFMRKSLYLKNLKRKQIYKIKNIKRV